MLAPLPWGVGAPLRGNPGSAAAEHQHVNMDCHANILWCCEIRTYPIIASNESNQEI